MRARSAISVIAVVISVCGGTVVETTLQDVSSSRIAPATTTTSTATTAPPVTLSSTSIAAEVLEPLEISRLENGLPAMFVAVTEGWEAVEVDTATGDKSPPFLRRSRPI